jgi:pimeloyl-ACP methyl ester carboxylesterase
MPSRRISRCTRTISRPSASTSASRPPGVLREADAHGFDRFHLVGYSGGGASALVLAALHGERLLSLALLEPAWAGNERTQQEEELMQRFRALDSVPPAQVVAEFARLQVASGVEPPAPPDGPPPPWMGKRPSGIRAFLDAFDAEYLDIEALKTFSQPGVLCARRTQ